MTDQNNDQSAALSLSTDATSPSEPTEMRRQAEEKVRSLPLDEMEVLSPEKIRQVLHELRVHQIELEMQNEELRLAQVKLEVSRARYFDLYDLAPVGYFTLSKQGLILEANLTAAGLLGKARSALSKQPLTRFIFDEDQDIYYRQRKQLFETETPQICELRVRRQDAGQFWARMEASLARDDTGATICLLVMSDVTERHRLEDQFRQAQKMESVGRLAGGVAHDYNNMLSVILGYTELALDEVGLSQPVHDYLTEIMKATRRSAEVTRQLLTFARKQTITPEVLDLGKTLESMIKMLRPLIGEDIDLVWLREASLWPIRMDPTQLHQVLTNLCVNARDAIAGVGKVTIETKNIVIDEAYCADCATFTPGAYVLLAVSDDGCGMDKETVEKVFEPFFTTKGVAQGTGLGLTTVYGIVDQNNGFITAKSEPGKGATFKVYLPRHMGEAKEARAESAVEIQKGRGESVLLVEDEQTMLQMVKMMLERLGYKVLTADTPSKAISLGKEHTDEIHLLITDVVMPEMNGPALAERMKAVCPKLKYLFMSGYTADLIAKRGFIEQGTAFLQKPFTLNSLASKVREVLDAPCFDGR